MKIRDDATDAVVSGRDPFLSLALKRKRLAVDYDQHNRTTFSEDMKFFANIDDAQWDPSIKTARELDDRPTLTINQMPRFVDQIMGDIRLNRPRIKTRPESKDSSVKMAQIFDGLIRNIEYRSNAEQVYDSACESMVAGGMGFWRVNTLYAENDTFEQDIQIEWIPNPLSVYFDPRPYDLDKTFAEWCFVTEWISRDEFSSRYPDTSALSLPETGRGDTEGWFEKDRIQIAEYWLREAVQTKIAQFEDGVVLEEKEARERAEQEKAKGLIGAIDGAPYKPVVIVSERTVTKHRVRRYIICGSGKLEGPEEFPCQYIPIVPVYGKMTVVEGKRYIRGMVRNAADSQRMYNYWRSAETEFVALQPKSPWLGTVRQFEGLESEWKDAHKKNIAVLRFNPDPNMPNGPQRQTPPQASPGMFQGATQALEDLKSTMGLPDANMGLSGNERTGKAIDARKVEGDVGNFSYPDNLTRSLRLTGRILMDMIPRVFDTSRSMFIRHQNDDEELIDVNMPGRDEKSGDSIIINDLSLGRYGIVIDTGPSFSTMRQETADGIIKFAQAFPQAAPLMQDLAAKSQDWELANEIAERLKRTIPPQYLKDIDPSTIPPSTEEIVSKSKAEIAELRVQREKIKALRDSINLKKEGSETRKEVLDILLELLKPEQKGGE